MKSEVSGELLTLFEQWYEQEMPRLYRYIWYRVRDQQIAEELTASVCERALSILHRYDSERGVMMAWMYGIAHNEVRGYFRSQRTRPALVSIDDLPGIRADSSLSVEGTYQRKEQIAAVLRHLAEMPERDQELVSLRYGAGLSNQEIAEITDLSENHVAVKLHRTLKRIRALLEAEHEAEDDSMISASSMRGAQDVSA